MADTYAEEIKANKEKIKTLEGKIEAATPAKDRNPNEEVEVLTWRQEIKELKLEIKELKLEREILELRVKIAGVEANPNPNENENRNVTVWRAEKKDKEGELERMRDKHAQERKELGERQVELERARTHSRPGDTQAIGSLGEKVARLELESQLRNAKSTTTRVEVYADFEQKNLISTLKLTGNIPKFEDFKTNKWTAALRVCPILVVVFDELTILVSF